STRHRRGGGGRDGEGGRGELRSAWESSDGHGGHGGSSGVGASRNQYVVGHTHFVSPSSAPAISLERHAEHLPPRIAYSPVKSGFSLLANARGPILASFDWKTFAPSSASILN